jgi:hypothetical protein
LTKTEVECHTPLDLDILKRHNNKIAKELKIYPPEIDKEKDRKYISEYKNKMEGSMPAKIEKCICPKCKCDSKKEDSSKISIFNVKENNLVFSVLTDRKKFVKVSLDLLLEENFEVLKKSAMIRYLGNIGTGKFVGVSKCNLEEDKFSYEIGYAIAKRKLLCKMTEKISKVIYSLSQEKKYFENISRELGRHCEHTTS